MNCGNWGPPPPYYWPPMSGTPSQEPTLEQLRAHRKMLDDYEKEIKEKDKKKDETKPKGRGYTHSDVTCLSLLLLATSPWSGQWVAKMYFAALHDWTILLK